MKLIILKSLAIMLLLSTQCLISLASETRLNNKNHRFQRKAQKRFKTEAKRKTFMVTRDAKDNFKNFLVGFRDKAVDSVSPCFKEAFFDGEKEKVSEANEIDDLYDDLKNQSYKMVKKLLSKVKKCNADKDKIDSYSNTYDWKSHNIGINLSPHRERDDWTDGKKDNPKDKPNAVEIANLAVYALRDAAQICKKGTDFSYYKVAENQILTAKKKLDEADYKIVEDESKDNTKVKGWVDNLVEKFKVIWNKIKTGFTKFLKNIQTYVTCKAKEILKAKVTDTIIEVLTGVGSFILDNIPGASILVKLYRVIASIYDFIEIGKEFYEAFTEKDKVAKYKGYGGATFLLCNQLLYIFTGFKVGGERRKMRIGMKRNSRVMGMLMLATKK